MWSIPVTPLGDLPPFASKCPQRLYSLINMVSPYSPYFFTLIMPTWTWRILDIRTRFVTDLNLLKFNCDLSRLKAPLSDYKDPLRIFLPCRPIPHTEVSYLLPGTPCPYVVCRAPLTNGPLTRCHINNIQTLWPVTCSATLKTTQSLFCRRARPRLLYLPNEDANHTKCVRGLSLPKAKVPGDLTTCMETAETQHYIRSQTISNVQSQQKNNQLNLTCNKESKLTGNQCAVMCINIVWIKIQVQIHRATSAESIYKKTINPDNTSMVSQSLCLHNPVRDHR